MEYYTLIQKHLAMTGIILQPSPNPFNLNLKNLAILIFAILHLVAQAKRFDEANIFEEYTDIVHKVIFLAIFVIFYAFVVWKTPELFGFVKTLDDRIRKSECHSKVCA